ncbi:hypothetical protein [uncultured Propionibacterium sp.]|uniref:hypothetical protein n=1 Tax=uncultured Propionibacterium sp. TaxID=218066 RepID=UPI00292F5BC0|nr:hypothetical protein [uncultured Propionibacterium sp.]
MTQMPTGRPNAPGPYAPADAGGPYQATIGSPFPQSRAPFVSRTDALAAMDASAELGPGLRRDVVDAFVADVNARMAVDWQQREYLRQADEQRESAERRARTRDLVICLSMSVPLTAIAGSFAGLIGMLASWAGIVAVAGALSLRRGAPDGRRELGR